LRGCYEETDVDAQACRAAAPGETGQSKDAGEGREEGRLLIEVFPLGPGRCFAAADLILELIVEEGHKQVADTHARLVAEIARALQTGTDWGFLAYALPEWQPAGIIMMRAAADPVAPRLEAFRYYVKPRYRHSQAGRRLVESVVDALPPALDLPVFISTVGPLRRSFRRLGFRTVAEVHAAPLSEIRGALRR
jgi:GNAT superfamily N-acetyltransferase